MAGKWFPCLCTVVLGALVIVFTWWQVTWAATALTVIGALIIIKGLINKCCCGDALKKDNTCCANR